MINWIEMKRKKFHPKPWKPILQAAEEPVVPTNYNKKQKSR